MHHRTDDVCVLAFIGFGGRLPRHIKGLLNRCGWVGYTFEVDAPVGEQPRSLMPHAVVIRGDLVDESRVEALGPLLAHLTGGNSIPVLVLVRPAQLVRVPEQWDCHFVTPGLRFDGLARVVRDVAAPWSTCCIREYGHAAHTSRRL